MIRKHLKNLQKKHGEIAKKYRAFIFRLDPDVLASDEEFKNIITELGYKTKKNIKDISQVLQPKYVFRLDLRNKTEEELLQYCIADCNDLVQNRTDKMQKNK